MDISKLTHGAKVVLGCSIAFLIVSFFNWQEVEFEGIASAGRSMWSGVGTIAGLLAIALIIWEAIHLSNMKIDLPLPKATVGAVLAILLAVFTFIKFVSDNEYRTFWAWLGLALAIAIAIGAFLNMKETGISISDMKNQMAGAAASATAAAKSATESRGDDTAASSAPSTTEHATDTAAEATESATEAAQDAADEHPPA